MSKINIQRGLLSLVTLFIALAISTSSAETRNYHASALYEAKGNVKSIKYDKNNQFIKKKVVFTPDGRLKNRLMSYNSAGLPIGYGSNMGDVYSYLNVGYDKDGSVSKIKWDNKNKNRSVALISPAYTDGVLKSALITLTVDSGAPQNIEYQFSDYIYDNSGNWISRKVTRTATPGGSGQPEVYTETRKIQYY